VQFSLALVLLAALATLSAVLAAALLAALLPTRILLILLTRLLLVLLARLLLATLIFAFVAHGVPPIAGKTLPFITNQTGRSSGQTDPNYWPSSISEMAGT
jgi:predicted PurR-regulated permease PerM